MIARQQYMGSLHDDDLNKRISHDEYYAQFGVHLVGLVRSRMKLQHIVNSDEHFNNIPLKDWDALQPAIMASVGRLLHEANGSGGVSLSDCVCAAKSAAKMIRDNAKVGEA